jgi:aspartate beta-hydroxylase
MAEADDRRIGQLIDAAAQAHATGRSAEGERLVRQAEAEAPRHPVVLNEIAKRKLLAGDPAGALTLLEAGLAALPDHPGLTLNLATALRGLGRHDEELAALNRVLKAEPTNMRALLQAAALHERRNDSRAAAATYRKALMLIPPGAQVPPEMRAVVEHARQAVAANGAALEAFLAEHLEPLRERFADEPLGRFDKSLATFLKKIIL